LCQEWSNFFKYISGPQFRLDSRGESVIINHMDLLSGYIIYKVLLPFKQGKPRSGAKRFVPWPPVHIPEKCIFLLRGSIV